MEVNLIECGSNDRHSPVLLCIFNQGINHEIIEAFSNKLGNRIRLVAVSNLPSLDKFQSFTRNLPAALERINVKRATLFGFAMGGYLAQLVALSLVKTIRRLVLLDAKTREEPDPFRTMLDLISSLVPCGLPIYENIEGELNSRSIIHKISAPTLVISSPFASNFVIKESMFIAKRIPNAWLNKLKTAPFDARNVPSDELCKLITEFFQVPTRRPQ